ncbi:hypothetical protein BK004_03940 [bacterium CG10_46_32]|nr:MAG: hypothetical protein BK004_03940 [bacterium CG10_46_32]
MIQTATSIVDHLTSLLRYDVDGSVKIFFPSKRSASDDPGTQAAIRWRREIEPRLDEAKRTQGMRVVTFPSIYHVLANAEELRRDMAALGVEHFATTAETTA